MKIRQNLMASWLKEYKRVVRRQRAREQTNQRLWGQAFIAFKGEVHSMSPDARLGVTREPGHP